MIKKKKNQEDLEREESYRCYLDRLSMPGCPVKLTAEEVKNLNESRIKPLYEV